MTWNNETLLVRITTGLAAMGFASLGLAGAGCAVEPSVLAEAETATESAKGDDSTAPACGVERGSDEHLDYCRSFSKDECEAELDCYWVNSIPLYGPSFCEYNDEYGPPVVVTNSCPEYPVGNHQPYSHDDLVISEIMVDTVDSAGYIEIYNSTPMTWDLTGCSLTNANGGVHVLDGVTMEARTWLILAGSDDPGFEPDGLYDEGFWLGEGEDEIAITCGGRLIDAVAYDDSWPSAPGHSIELETFSFDATKNDDPAEWCLADRVLENGNYGSPYKTWGCN